MKSRKTRHYHIKGKRKTLIRLEDIDDKTKTLINMESLFDLLIETFTRAQLYPKEAKFCRSIVKSLKNTKDKIMKELK